MTRLHPVRRTHAERSSVTRQHLINSAIQVIQDKSYESVSIFEIAKTAGVTPGALQHHFASKAELMMQVLSQVILAQDQAGALWPQADAPLEQRARAFVHAAWKCIYGQPRFVAAWNIYLGSRAQPDVVDHIAQQRQVLNRRMRDGFLKAFPELVDTPQADAFIAMVFSALRGLGLLGMFKPTAESTIEQLDCIAAMIVNQCTTVSKSPTNSTKKQEIA